MDKLSGQLEKRVSDLSNFLGTIARNSRFITLLYTGCPAVPKDTKLRMWEYVNNKFIIPAEGEKWVMDGLRDAWRRHKRYVKENNFDKYKTLEDRLKNCPSWIPEVQFRQLIEYQELPTVKAIKKQKWRRQMGPVNFGRVCMALRATKENNEEPSKAEMFIATRTKNEKQVDPETEVVIEEVKELKEEVVELRKLQGLKEEVQELQQLRHLMKLLVKNNPGLNLEDAKGFIGSNQPSPVDSSSVRATRVQNIPRSSGSTHGPTLGKETYGDAIGNGGRKLS